MFVVELFDGSGDSTGDANAVAAHDVGFGLAVLVKEGRMEGFGILRAQFKDLADFDAANDFDGCTAVRAFVAGDHVADGRDRHVFEVPRRIDVLIVIAGLIGTGYAIGDVPMADGSTRTKNVSLSGLSAPAGLM